MHEAANEHSGPTPEQRVVELEAQLADRDARLAEATRTITRLRDQYTRALEKLVLMQRRLFVASAERRPDESSDQLEFELRVAEVAALKDQLAAAEGAQGAIAPDAAAPSKPGAPIPGATKQDGRKKRSTPPRGRRDIALADLPEIRVPIVDPELEGKAERIGTVESRKLGHERGGARCLVLEIAVYKKPADVPASVPVSGAPSGETGAWSAVVGSATTGPREATTERHECEGSESATSARCAEPKGKLAKTTGPKLCIARSPMPKEIVWRGMLAPSMIAHLLVQKYLMGMPFYRLEQQFAREGFALDRGTMCRYAEEVGAVLGFVVDAARREALETAFCLSTDATGVSIQPEPLDDGRRQPCRKGHFFVILADRDHVFFEFQAKHTSLAAWNMFKGFKGHIQADAHVIYDAVFRGIPPEGADESIEDAKKLGPPPLEVGCWAHVRRHMWEAAVCKYVVGLEGLRRIHAIFDADRPLQDLPPAQRKLRREQLLRPLVDDFFTWVKTEKPKLTGRGLVASALGYALNQEQALRRFLTDGRLRLENNGAERALRGSIAIGRNAWLFFGSDDHASAAANLFSLIASCKLHGLDPEAYLAEVIRIFPYWPPDRRLELAPKYWVRTRARLDPKELELPLGRISVPLPAPEEQRAAG